MDIKTPREYFLDEAIKRHWNVLYGSKIGLDFCKEYADYYHQAKLKELTTPEERGYEFCECDKWHDRMEESNNNCSTCDKPMK